MVKYISTLTFIVICSILTWGCDVDQSRDYIIENTEIINNLHQAGFPDYEVAIVDGLVYVGNDAVVNLIAFREMLQHDTSTNEQYYTTNRITHPPPGIARICVNGASTARAGAMFSEALDEALSNYNALFNAGTTELQFQRVTESQSASCRLLINVVIKADLTGGSSGFPSAGRPFNQIVIGRRLASFGVNVITHVIMHELGHTIGLRHSDFFNRSISCGGTAFDEGSAGVGANLVPGTPSGAVAGGSIMNSCFRTIETGEFTSSDITALNFLY